MERSRFHRELAAGDWLFREGEAGDGAYLIEQGTVEVLLERHGQQDVVAELGPGELLGEMALIDGGARSASARASSTARLRRVTQDQLTRSLEGADPTLRVLLRLLLERMRGSMADPQAPAAPMAAQHSQDQHDRNRVADRIALEQDLALALERGEFRLQYQPIVRLSDFTVAGFEALLRWPSPARGAVSPGAFIPLAESSDLIAPIGAWVAGEACRALRRMAPARELFMNVNLSGRQLGHPGLVDELAAAAAAADLPAGRIKLEVTESTLLEDFEHAVQVLERLRRLGFRVAVDDFGTGYSSLALLHRFPADTLKIDQGFVSRIVQDAPSRKIVQAMGDLAHTLGMEIVAEGVETPEQARLLREMGYEFAQGYLFARGLDETAARAVQERSWAGLLHGDNPTG